MLQERQRKAISDSKQTATTMVTAASGQLEEAGAASRKPEKAQMIGMMN